jgi:hypothetical protein
LRDIGYGEVAGNFAIASVGNIIGGVLLVTLSRFSQARAASRYVGPSVTDADPERVVVPERS